MTFDEIKNYDEDTLVPTDIAPILHCSAYSINLQAQTDPTKLGFPVSMVGTRVKIPKQGFIAFWEGRKKQNNGG